MAKLHFIRQPSCKKCGTELIADRAEYCSDCLRRQRSFEYGIALIRYDAVAQKSMAAVKYKNRREYLDFYAEAIARRDRKSTRLNSSHIPLSRMPSSA